MKYKYNKLPIIYTCAHLKFWDINNQRISDESLNHKEQNSYKVTWKYFQPNGQ